MNPLALHEILAAGSAQHALIEPGFLLGLMLLAAFAGAALARAIHLPRVIGFLVAGIALKLLIAVIASGLGNTDWSDAIHSAADTATSLSTITDLALGLILFSIGAVFEATNIRSIGPRALRIGGLEMGLTLIFVALGTALVSWLAKDWPLSETLALALFLGIAAMATAPAATLLVLREYDAKGPMTDMVLTLTGINNVICIVLFHVSFLLLAWTGVIQTRPDPGRIVLVDLFLTTIGSAALGLVLGMALCWFYARNNIPETLLIFLATLLALGAGRNWLAQHLHLSYSYLLTSLTIGAVFANVAINPERFNTSLNTLTTPLYAAFFVLAGFTLHLEDLPRLGWIGAAYILLRIAGKLLGVWRGARWAKLHATIKPWAGTALLCQAGVVIGLASFLDANWVTLRDGQYVSADMVSVFYTLILGAVTVFELCGPLLVKNAVVQAGEVKAVQLWSRPTAPAPVGASVTALLLESLWRLLGIQRPKKDTSNKLLLVRHVMRTNVKLLHESDPFNDVMHFVERSRFHHFPVADDRDKLIGMIHFADLRDIIYEPALRALVTAGDLADGGAPCAALDDSLEELMNLFHKTDFGVLAVVDDPANRKVVGLVEQRDILRYAASPETKEEPENSFD